MSERHRRLAAIMFTDMVGYTALGQRNESLSLALVDEQRKLIRPILGRHGGREIKTIGDAFLVEFASALNAVRCAYDIQRAVREFNFSLEEGRRLRLRVGIHLGEVVAESEDSDISGDAVNVASRIESLAEDGGVCITRQVFDQIQNKFELPFTNLGRQALKNVKDRVEIYGMVLPWAEARSPGVATNASSLDRRGRIAILPFSNISRDTGDEYFADGMTEELISTISRIGGLRVIARTSAMHYKGQTNRISDIANQLQVASLLEGSVRKSGDRVRISAQLVDGSSEEHLWAEDYERNLDDVFLIQRDIATRIAQELKIKLLPGEERRIERNDTKNSWAYVLYLKGRYYWSERTEEGLRNAQDYFEKAIEADPSFARAYSGLADTYSIIASQGQHWGRETILKAKSMAEKALEIDDELPEAHASIGIILWDMFQWEESERHLTKALELSPSYATAHFWYSLLLLCTGQGSKAIEEARQAEELDPLSPAISLALGQALLYSRHFQQAVVKMEKKVKDDPSLPSHYMLAMAYFFNGMYENAAAESRIIIAISPSHHRAQTILAMSLARTGRKEEAEAMLADLRNSNAQAFLVAMLLIELGDEETAMDVLEKGLHAKEPGFVWVSVVPTFDALGSNPRFKKLLGEMNLPVRGNERSYVQ